MKRNNYYPLGLQVLDHELKRSQGLIDHFVYNCSHAIRSPLKSMEGLVTLLRDYPVTNTDEWKAYLRLIKSSGTMLGAVLAHFSDLEANATAGTACEPVDFDALILHMVEAFREQLSDKHIVVNTRVNQRGTFLGDRKRIVMALSRLVANAIVYQEPEKENKIVDIFVVASAQHCHIQVRDSGIGISMADQKKLFQPFFRGASQSTGAGLGLFVASQVIKKLGGTIGVRSNPDEGSAFSLSIPSQG